MTKTLTQGIYDLVNETRQASASNIDQTLHDYQALTDIESLSKKFRKKALEECLKLTDKEEAGILVRGGRLSLELRVVEATSFDLDVFFDKLTAEESCTTPRWRLRELAEASKIAVNPRKHYKVVDND